MTLFLLAMMAQDFKEQTIDPDAGVGYALTIADVNADGKPDVVVVTEQPDQVLWYENPTWKRRTVVAGTPKLPVCVQAMDVDGDGKTGGRRTRRAAARSGC